MKVEILEVAGIVPAMQALRLPYSREPRSSKTPFAEKIHEYDDEYIAETNKREYISKADITLAGKLVKGGDCEAKAVRGIIAYLRITAPLYFWNEFCTYRHGSECLSSTSSMHTLGKRAISIRDFDLPEIVYETLDPIKKEKEIKPLFVSSPADLKSVILNFGERDYEVWNNGEIYSLPYSTHDKMPSGNIRVRKFEKTKLIPHSNRNGYYVVSLGGRKFHKNYLVHRLLAECFIPNPNNLPVVNHIDGNKWNCSLGNLEWCTSQHNNIHARETGLNNPNSPRANYLSYWNKRKWSDKDIAAWIQLRESGLLLEEIAQQVGTTASTVCQYIKGNRHDFMSPNWQDYEYIKGWEVTLQTLNSLADAYRESNSEEAFLSLKKLLPSAFLQTRIFAVSYQCLRNMWIWRRNHRLKEWHIFLDAVKQLPFAEQLIFVEK